MVKMSGPKTNAIRPFLPGKVADAGIAVITFATDINNASGKLQFRFIIAPPQPYGIVEYVLARARQGTAWLDLAQASGLVVVM